MTLPSPVSGSWRALFRVWGSLVLLLVTLWGCRPAPSPATSSPGAPPSQAKPTSAATATLAPTATPSPPPAVVFLWTTPETGEDRVTAVREWWAQQAPDPSWVLEVGSDVDAAFQTARVQAVLAAPEVPPGLAAEKARMYPQVPFLAMGAWKGQDPPPENLILLDPTGTEPAYRAFLAGYLSTLLSPNWRGVMVAPAPLMETLRARAFVAGGRYYCGLCRPPKPPVLAYPRLQPVLGGEGATPWRQACEKAVLEDRVETVYLVDAPDPSVVSCFRQWSVAVLWDGPAPQDADVSMALRAPTWPEILATYGASLWTGTGGQVIPLPLIFDVRDADFQAEHQGKLAEAREVWEMLTRGWIALPEDEG